MRKHIALVAPSSRVSEENTKFTKNYFETLGMKVTAPEDLFGEDLLCAHQDKVRLFHLKSAFEDPSVDVIWLLMGGYGLGRLMPDLFHIPRPKKEKLFIGFSDGTALHIFLNQVWNWPTLHGIGALQAARQVVDVTSIKKTLQFVNEGLSSYQPPSLSPLNKKAKKINKLTGLVVGGNLCLLQTSIGTRWQAQTEGKILFLEDVDERGYRIDRMLIHLQQAGLFDRVKAIVLGDFTKGEEKDGSSLVVPVLERFAHSIDVPVFSLRGCGHGKENLPLPFNIELTFPVLSV